MELDTGGVGAASVEQRCHLYLVAGDTRCAVHDATSDGACLVFVP
jgi:hypothetical protein